MFVDKKCRFFLSFQILEQCDEGGYVLHQRLRINALHTYVLIVVKKFKASCGNYKCIECRCNVSRRYHEVKAESFTYKTTWEPRRRLRLLRGMEADRGWGCQHRARLRSIEATISHYSELEIEKLANIYISTIIVLTTNHIWAYLLCSSGLKNHTIASEANSF